MKDNADRVNRQPLRFRHVLVKRRKKKRPIDGGERDEDDDSRDERDDDIVAADAQDLSEQERIGLCRVPLVEADEENSEAEHE
jgi:hypothetical protein